MAAGLTVDVLSAPVRGSIGRIVDTLDGGRSRLMFDVIGQALVTSTVDRFERETGPDGRAWEPSQRALEEGGQTLTDKGLLRGSITHVARRDGVDVGTNVPYGAIHQFGSGDLERPKNIPARPYLGLDAADALVIERIVERLIEGAV